MALLYDIFIYHMISPCKSLQIPSSFDKFGVAEILRGSCKRDMNSHFTCLVFIVNSAYKIYSVRFGLESITLQIAFVSLENLILFALLCKFRFFFYLFFFSFKLHALKMTINSQVYL